MSEIAPRQQCPVCLDKGQDNLITYKDGQYCFSCGYKNKTGNNKMTSSLISGIHSEIKERGISRATCEHYNVRVKEFTGRLGKHEFVNELITIYPLYENGRVVKQKIRSQIDKKKQTQVGKTDNYSMFGQHAFSPTKKLPVIVTTGEYDAMCIYQETGLPTVSVTRGDNGAEKELLENLEWLSNWREVLLCFDMDESGQKEASTCITIFEPGTVKNISLPLKDANEMILQGRGSEIKKYLSTAETIKPSTVVFPMEIIDEILTPAAYGSPWPWSFMTKVTYGNRLGEVYMLAGDTSVGKTQIMYEIVGQHIKNGCKVGLIDLERQNAQTIQRIIGSVINMPLHLPPIEASDFPKEIIREEVEKLKDKLVLYRPESGKLTIESILINIRYLNKAYGINFFVLDNLTALSVNLPSGIKEHEFASATTGQLVQIARELNVTIFIINHLSKSPVQLNADITMGDEYVYSTNKQGLSWESGRIPEITHIYGGGKVAKLPDYLIVCARNRLSDDINEKRTIHIKFLKTRFESSYEGHTFKLLFNQETGKLTEVY